MGYLEDRAERTAEQAFKMADRSEKQLKALFKNSGTRMRKEVDAFYARYGIIAESPVFETLPDGTEVVKEYRRKLVVPANVAEYKLAVGTRLTKLEGQLTNIVKDLSKETIDHTTNTLSDVAKWTFYESMYTTASHIGIGTSFDLLTKPQVTALIKNPLHGADFVKRTNINNEKLARNVNQTLRAGITQGLSNKDMTKNLAGHMDMGYRDAKRIIQTETTNSMNQAAIESYKASGVVDEYVYIATLDDRTTDKCTRLDGQTFLLDDAVSGVNLPPTHVGCRSTTGAYFEETANLFTRMARDLDGKNFTVPSKMNGQSFKDIYVNKSVTRSAWDATNK